ncbi:MAG: hypothetical protein K2J67_02665 [Lachnospiraceae bacterium]|nr:hypothetical protein [Lachnospiraceae bacterium]
MAAKRFTISITPGMDVDLKLAKKEWYCKERVVLQRNTERYDSGLDCTWPGFFGNRDRRVW